jgi:predicted dehydrogenase
MDVLANVLGATLRRTDTVLRTREREVGVVLVETVGEQVHPPVARIREVVAQDLGKIEVRIGWASVGPGHRRSWEEAWRWAGQLLVADAAVPAAA